MKYVYNIYIYTFGLHNAFQASYLYIYIYIYVYTFGLHKAFQASNLYYVMNDIIAKGRWPHGRRPKVDCESNRRHFGLSEGLVRCLVIPVGSGCQRAS